MTANLRAVPTIMPPCPPAPCPPSPSPQGWVWDGVRWACDPDCGPPMPPPCPPPGWPTPCPPWFPPPANQAPWYPGANAGVSFSANPPANPIRGNFWWDGVMLHMFDGVAWVDIGPGAAPGTGPGPGPVSTTTVVFAMQQPIPLTVAASTWTIVPFNSTPMTDTQSAWSSVTFKYTPKAAGNYFVEARVISGTAAGIAIVKNDPGTFTGTSNADIVVGVANGSTNQWITATGIVNMNGTTDFIRVWGFESGGSFPAAGSSPVYAVVAFP